MAKRKPLVFVKLGGAAITFKDIPKKANDFVIDRCAQEIAQVLDKKRILLAHGGGSFPHPIASKYKVNQGLKVCGVKGMAETQRAARELNNIVVNNLLDRNVPAFQLQTSSLTISKNGKIKKMFLSPIKKALADGMVPVLYGDVAIDLKKGCSIASTEMLFSYLAEKLKPSSIIVGTDVDGVYTINKQGVEQLVPEINRKNFNNILRSIGSSRYTDVTGGMRHKVEELYRIARNGISIQIVNLLKEENLKRAVLGEHVGTVIK